MGLFHSSNEILRHTFKESRLQQNLSNINYLPTCSSRLVAQHSCQVSFKSMQWCRRSWEDKLKCVKILSVKGHNSAKICRIWIISPQALLDLWYNICTKFPSNRCKDVGGVEKTNFDGTEGRKDRKTEWRTKQTLNAPLPFYGGGIIKLTQRCGTSDVRLTCRRANMWSCCRQAKVHQQS